MIEVEIRGFQSIEHVKIRLDGFTALVGRSNIGKSAVVRAIKSALTNSLGTSFVRHNPSGCARSLRKAKTCRCQSSVHLKAEGFDLLWEKGDAVNRYTFNGQVFDKPGQGIPEFLANSGFSTVRVGDDAGLIQVADQFFPIFMLNQSGPATAEAISDVARLDRVNAATRLVEKDRRDVIATKKVREKDASELRGRLESYDGLDAALSEVQGTVQKLAMVEAQRSTVDQLSGYVLTSEALVKRIRTLWEVGSVVIPDEGPVRERATTIEALRRFASEMTRRVEGYKALEWVEGFMEVVPSVDPVLEVAGRIKELSGWIGKLKSYRDRFTALDAIAQIPNQDQEALTEGQTALRTMSGLILRYRALTNSIASLEKELEEVSKEEQVVQEEVDAIGVCPTCTQPFHAGHQHA